jgi:hypothetical protein
MTTNNAPYRPKRSATVSTRRTVGSTALASGSGSHAGAVGKVAPVGIPGLTSSTAEGRGKVASAAIPGVTTVAVSPKLVVAPVSAPPIAH